MRCRSGKGTCLCQKSAASHVKRPWSGMHGRSGARERGVKLRKGCLPPQEVPGVAIAWDAQPRTRVRIAGLSAREKRATPTFFRCASRSGQSSTTPKTGHRATVALNRLGAVRVCCKEMPRAPVVESRFVERPGLQASQLSLPQRAPGAVRVATASAHANQPSPYAYAVSGLRPHQRIFSS